MNGTDPFNYGSLYGKGIEYTSNQNITQFSEMGLYSTDYLKKTENFSDFMTNTLPNSSDYFNIYEYWKRMHIHEPSKLFKILINFKLIIL